MIDLSDAHIYGGLILLALGLGLIHVGIGLAVFGAGLMALGGLYSVGAARAALKAEADKPDSDEAT